MGHQWSPWWAAGICIVLIGTVSPLEKTAVGAEPPPSGLRDAIVCSDLESDVERLQCYDDEAVQRGVRRGKDPDAAAADVVRPPSLMGRRWELDPGKSMGSFRSVPTSKCICFRFAIPPM